MEHSQPLPRRRLSDLLVALDFCEVQLEMLQRGGPPHRARHLALRIAALHHRMDQLERALRLRAAQLLDETGAPVSELRKRLARLERRHRRSAEYQGRERRRWQRRATDAQDALGSPRSA